MTNRYDLALNKKPEVSQPYKDTAKRGMQMMEIPMGQLPPLALEYSKYLCNRYGMCGEVLLTAYCHYAEAVEGTSTSDIAYQLDEKGKEWFKLNIPMQEEITVRWQEYWREALEKQKQDEQYGR
jgi:hypothetical protein